MTNSFSEIHQRNKALIDSAFNFVYLRGSILRNAMYNNNNDKGKYGNFPDPFAHYTVKRHPSTD